MKYGIVMGLVAMFAASAAMAEGLPSKGKLNKLGLGSMEVVSDQAGEQVRGKAFFKVIFIQQSNAGEKFLLNSDGTFVIDPANFVAHDFNANGGIVTDGLPLGNGSLFFTNPIVVANAADAFHQQDIIDPTLPIAFTEISASNNSFQFNLFFPLVGIGAVP